MIKTVYNLLSPINVPILYIRRPEINGANKVGISYHFFSEGYELHGDGQGVELGGSLQVDIFSLNDYSSTVNQVRQLLEAGKFRLTDMSDTDDILNNVKYYQKRMIFNYAESEVK